MIEFFDGHNDVLWRLSEESVREPERLFLSGRADGHVDLPRARRGGMVGGLFALWAPSRSGLDLDQLVGDAYDAPLAPEVPLPDALALVGRQLSIAKRVVDASAGQVVICTTSAAIRQARSEGRFAIVLHMEGAEAIDPDLHALDVLYLAGLRSLGIAWSRTNRFGHGVPMRFPSAPDTGPGLTPAGFDLVRACNRLGIQIDVSHLTETGFWDVVKTSRAPVVATHSNVHALSRSSRNLTDRQLDAIRDSDGMVGLNLATAYLRADGQMLPDTGIDDVVRHIDALIERVGETRVGLGSDFDGAVIPEAVGTVAGSQTIFSALSAKGYGAGLLQKLAVDNWLRVLERAIG